MSAISSKLHNSKLENSLNNSISKSNTEQSISILNSIGKQKLHQSQQQKLLGPQEHHSSSETLSLQWLSP